LRSQESKRAFLFIPRCWHALAESHSWKV